VVNPARVLVVDDEPAIRALVARIVERAGFAVDTARDGGDAIARLDAGAYDVLVVDLMMPNVDGYRVIEHLRDRGRDRPAVIVITAGDSASIRALDGGLVHSVLRKPFDIDVLGDLITTAANTMREERENNSHLIQFPPRQANDKPSC
jgi:DNA-binding response OmpR family regulator